ncbi:proteoglycan 4-like [Pararge aegeria]|uniref:Jg12223 protein n=2 Tax=Pararge aegeria TaxID=116150 RepID=A0A8S4SG53_9NEOP|nr:proteoglycan 4-like [Pararge aegeria]CAH2261679.1 jg12223 [Pararge aegeria aegeria]
MKKVIFLCLLSLSVCLSKPAENQAAPTLPPATAKAPNTTDPSHPAQVITETQPAPNKEQSPAISEPGKAAAASTNQNSPTTPKETAVSPTKETPVKESPKPTDDNKTQNKEEEKTEAPKPKEGITPTKTANETSVVPTEKASKTSTDKSDEGKAKEETKPAKDVTAKPTESPKTTEAPKSDKDAHIVQSGGFSGPSFIGGIILTLGLLAIGFMGFKYYKNQTERNYHTL